MLFLPPAPYIVGHLGAEVFVELEPDPVQLSWWYGARQMLHRAADLGHSVIERALDIGLDAGRGGRLVVVQREILPVLTLVMGICRPRREIASGLVSCAWSESFLHFPAMPRRRAGPSFS